MLPALLVVAGLFCALFLVRFGAARRSAWLSRWPALLLAGAALFALSRGVLWAGFILAGLAGVVWFGAESFLQFPRAARDKRSAEDVAAAQARLVLGVGPDADDAEIRRAYRTKMASAHPDKGGGHAQAARLTAARDLLLKRKR